MFIIHSVADSVACVGIFYPLLYLHETEMMLVGRDVVLLNYSPCLCTSNIDFGRDDVDTKLTRYDLAT